MISDALGLARLKSYDYFYQPRLYYSQEIYINASDGQRLLIGVDPAENFSACAYIYANPWEQMRIPVPLPVFIEKITALLGPAQDSSTNIQIDAEAGSLGYDISIAKDGEDATYKISGSLRPFNMSESSLKYLVAIAKPLAIIYEEVAQRQEEAQTAFDNLTCATITKVLEIDSLDYKEIERAMYASMPPGIDIKFYSEVLCNFRNYYYGKVRDAFCF